MFAGIVEKVGIVKDIISEGTNKHFHIQSSIAPELHIDQSIAHNGVCLTVVALFPDNSYKVTAIKETLDKSNLGSLLVDDKINLERSITMESRIDGHHVQGHVDATATCIDIEEVDGSWYYTFQYSSEFQSLLVNKGSVAINGVSLTVIDPTDSQFKIAIIPYTYHNTNFHQLITGSKVNIEFDIIGKYVARNLAFYQG
jgi:riboflavin synthase